MTQRSPALVVILTIVTFGIYGIVWLVSTKREMVKLGADIPTSWLLIVPFANIWYLWKYSEGVEKITSGKTSGPVAFILLFLLRIVAMPILQSEYNKISEQEAQNESLF